MEIIKKKVKSIELEDSDSPPNYDPPIPEEVSSFESFDRESHSLTTENLVVLKRELMAENRAICLSLKLSSEVKNIMYAHTDSIYSNSFVSDISTSDLRLKNRILKEVIHFMSQKIFLADELCGKLSADHGLLSNGFRKLGASDSELLETKRIYQHAVAETCFVSGAIAEELIKLKLIINSSQYISDQSEFGSRMNESQFRDRKKDLNVFRETFGPVFEEFRETRANVEDIQKSYDSFESSIQKPLEKFSSPRLTNFKLHALKDDENNNNFFHSNTYSNPLQSFKLSKIDFTSPNTDISNSRAESSESLADRDKSKSFKGKLSIDLRNLKPVSDSKRP